MAVPQVVVTRPAKNLQRINGDRRERERERECVYERETERPRLGPQSFYYMVSSLFKMTNLYS